MDHLRSTFGLSERTQRSYFWLVVTGWLLLAVCYWLFVIGWLLLAGCYWLVTGWLFLVGCYWLVVSGWLLLAGCFWLVADDGCSSSKRLIKLNTLTVDAAV